MGAGMEGGPPSGGTPKAARSGKALWAIVALIVAIAVIASATVLLVLPGLQGPSYAKFTVTTLDFSYDRIDFNPEHHVKVNQPIWVVMSNEGTNDHEFLLYTDKGAALIAANNALAVALAHHPNATIPSAPDFAAEKQAALDEYDTLHDSWANLTRYNNIDRDVAPGDSTDLLFVIHTAGTYYFVCHQVDTTDIPWMVHQGRGMWGTIIVDP